MDGPRLTIQGTLTPLLGIGACVSIQFGALQYAKRAFAARHPHTDLGLGELFAAGAFAGVANTVVANPVEHIRIRQSPLLRRPRQPARGGGGGRCSSRLGLQTQPNVTPRLYSGPLDCARKLYGTAGIAGVFKGQVSTIWRDGLGYG